MQDGKKNGQGILYDPERDEVYDGSFEMNKKSGEGMIYQRDGHVLKGEFRNNCMEGQFENVMKIKPHEVTHIFNRAKIRNAQYISVNKERDEKVFRMLRQARPETQFTKDLSYSPAGRTRNLLQQM